MNLRINKLAENISDKKDRSRDIEKSIADSMGLPADFIMENAMDGVIQLKEDGLILKTNSHAEKILAIPESGLASHSIYDLIPKEYHSLLENRIKEQLLRGNNIDIEKEEDLFLFRCLSGNNKYKSFEAIILPYKQETERTFFLNIWEPESDSEKLVDQLKEVQKNYESLSETISEAVIIIDESFKIIYANSATIRVFGYDKKEITGKSFEILFPEELFKRYASDIKKYFYVDFDDRKEINIDDNMELLARNKNRGVSPIEISFGNSREFHERTLTCIIRDVSHRKNIERKLRYLAYHDKLTDLGNRDLFTSDITSLFDQMSSGSIANAALFFLDLDGFKQVNDTFGHQAGDEILIDTAQRLRDTLRESDLIYRFGGDEFVVLLTRVNEKKDAELVARKILASISRSFIIDQNGESNHASIGVSIGIALIPDQGSDHDTITKNADLAMYSAKENGKNQYVVFSEDLTHTAKNKWTIEQGLKSALVRQEMFIEYQPIHNNGEGIAGVEALIRWEHGSRGVIPPDLFIPAAEENGMIIPIGLWVLDRACMDIRLLNRKLKTSLFLSVNISTKQLMLPNFPELIDGVINRTGLDPRLMKLEITETFLMEDPEKICRTLSRLKKEHPGVTLIIDDFGKGYSSLSYLSRLPVECIKIDRDFIRNIPEPTNMKVISSIVNLAENLDLYMVAEGIETEEQLNNSILKRCHFIQGYYYSHPLRINKLIDYIRNQ